LVFFFFFFLTGGSVYYRQVGKTFIRLDRITKVGCLALRLLDFHHIR
jgi:hypothetical protein